MGETVGVLQEGTNRNEGPRRSWRILKRNSWHLTRTWRRISATIDRFNWYTGTLLFVILWFWLPRIQSLSSKARVTAAKMQEKEIQHQEASPPTSWFNLESCCKALATLDVFRAGTHHWLVNGTKRCWYTLCRVFYWGFKSHTVSTHECVITWFLGVCFLHFCPTSGFCRLPSMMPYYSFMFQFPNQCSGMLWLLRLNEMLFNGETVDTVLETVASKESVLKERSSFPQWSRPWNIRDEILAAFCSIDVLHMTCST